MNPDTPTWQWQGNSSNLHFYRGPDDYWCEVLISALAKTGDKWIAVKPTLRMTLYQSDSHGSRELGRTSWRSQVNEKPTTRTVARMANRLIRTANSHSRGEE